MSRLEAGAGGRPLLLVHGHCAAKEDFADWIEPLAERGWHVVAPDLRGHGAAPKPDDESAYSFEAFADDLLDLADSLGWDRFTLLGHSMGGMVAQVLALAHPHRLDALILMDTTHGPLPHVDPEILQLGITVCREQGIEVLHALTKEYASPITTEAYERMVRENPDYEAYGDRKFLACAPAMWAATVELMYSQQDRLDALRTLDVPTLVLVGEGDDAFFETSKRMAATIPGAELAVIPDAGHSPQFEAPAAWWAALTSFLDRVAASSTQPASSA